MALFQNFGRIKNQIFASIILTIGDLVIGCATGWFSPALLVFTSDDTPLTVDGPMSSFDVGWVTAYNEIGTLCGIFLFCLIANYIGHKRSLILCIIPIIIAWPIIYFAKAIWLIGVARILLGSSYGGYTVCSTLLLAQISDDKIRGLLTGIVQSSNCVGIELGYVAGSYLSFRVSAIVFCALGCIAIVAMLRLIPSAPQHWLRVNNIKAAEKSLRFYRNCSSSTDKWNNDEKQLQEELQKLNEIAKLKVGKKKLTLSDFSNRKAMKGMVSAIGLVFIFRFCGSTVTIHYASTIFKESGSTIDPNVSAVIMGTLLIVGYLCGTILMDITGRKTLLMLSAAGGCISLLVTSIFTYLVVHGLDLTIYNSVPVVFLSIFQFSSSIGIGPIHHVMIPELLPRNIREFGTGISLCMSGVFAFIVLILFPIWLEWIQLYGCLWIFAGLSAAGFVFIWCCIPETKGTNLNTSAES